ncbi:pyridoxal phosphate-dependent aminotransferase [Pseudomonas fluorescens]|uniref:aminotransferase class I/II-fold pyridoxal phosphate-dependent enzyme n=1 Tax=Pseudomonas fluorescens TaxID=294 RepID=UPI000A7F156E|nr:pyridoxal phosphate-dependent aminotransferase [Pseudomonas fluorescens]
MHEVGWLMEYRDAGNPAGPPIFLSLGETWERTPQALLDLLGRAPRHVHGYQIAMGGYPPLRQKLHSLLEREYSLKQDWHSNGRYEVGVCATGTRSLIYDYARYLAKHYAAGRRPVLLTFAPAWDYAGPFRAAGFTTRFLPLLPERGFAPDLAEILDAVDAAGRDPSTTAVFALNVQQNPTAQNLSPDLVDRLLGALVARKIPILIDDAYFAVTAPGTEPTCAMRMLLQRLDDADEDPLLYPWLLVRSLGKQFSCNGWGIGIAAAPPALLENLFNEWQLHHHYNINGLFQHALAEWIDSPDAEAYTQTQRSEIQDNRQHFLQLLHDHLGYPSTILSQSGTCTSFQLFPIPLRYTRQPHGAQRFVEDCMRQAGVLFTDAWPLPYNRGPDLMEYGFARVFLSARQSTLEEAVHRMEKVGLFYGEARPC